MGDWINAHAVLLIGGEALGVIVAILWGARNMAHSARRSERAADRCEDAVALLLKMGER